MRQTGSIFKVLKDTTWPDRKQRWHDFISVLEYTAFFTVIIYAFDELLSRAMSALINFFFMQGVFFTMFTKFVNF